MFALDDLKRSYAYGNFMATVLLAQVFIEQSLGGSYALAGQDCKAQRTFAHLIDAARDAREHYSRFCRRPSLFKKNAKSLHTFYNRRNASYLDRLVQNKFASPEDLVVEDAKFAVRTVVNYLRRGSPNWHPEKVKWSEDDA